MLSSEILKQVNSEESIIVYKNKDDILTRIESLLIREKNEFQSKISCILADLQPIQENVNLLSSEFLFLIEKCQKQSKEIENLRIIESQNRNLINLLNEKILSFEKIIDENLQKDQLNFEIETSVTNYDSLFKQIHSNIQKLININENNELNSKIQLEFEIYKNCLKSENSSKLKKFISKIKSLNNYLKFLKDCLSKQKDFTIFKENFSIINEKQINFKINSNLSEKNSELLVSSEGSSYKNTEKSRINKFNCLSKKIEFLDKNAETKEFFSSKIDKELLEISRNFKVNISRLIRKNGRITLRVGGGYYVVKDYNKEVSPDNLKSERLNITSIEGDQKINGTKRTSNIKKPLEKKIKKDKKKLCSLSHDYSSNSLNKVKTFKSNSILLI